MSCEGCVNNRCGDCKDGSRYVKAIPRVKHEPSAWERRWIKWAKKEAKK